jgi:cytochrome c-type biogenesis protein CcmH/NrfG
MKVAGTTPQEIEALLRAGAVNEAREKIEALAQNHPEQPEMWLMLGNLLYPDRQSGSGSTGQYHHQIQVKPGIEGPPV